MFSEEDAKLRWCPFARVSEMGGTYNRRGPTANVQCIGSDCLAWRWNRAKETKAYLDAVQAYMKGENVNFNIATNKVWAEIGSTFEQVEGYCGIGGKP